MSQESAAQSGEKRDSVSVEALRGLADEWMKLARFEARVAERFAKGSEARAACDAVSSAYAACYAQLTRAIDAAAPAPSATPAAR